MAKGTNGPRKRTAKSANVAQTVAPAAPKKAVFFRPGRIMFAAATALGLLCVPLMLRWLPRLELRPEYRITAAQITLSTPPRWVPPDLAAQVFRSAGMSDEESLQDDSLSERIAAAFHTHPWIERVISVRKSFPARVHVDVVYREPVAMVRGIDGHYPIDRHGILLPARDFADADLERYPVIEHVASVPMGQLGEPWGDPAVTGAAELAAALCTPTPSGDIWWTQLELSAIVVPKRVVLEGSAEDLEFSLKTRGGSEILWGHRPGSKFPGELPVNQKLQRLADFRHDYGSFDDAHGPYQIDIRPWQGIGRTTIARGSDRRDVR